MKSTGVVRKIDDLGRVVLPKELRRTMGIESGDPLEVYVDGDKIILKKYIPNAELQSVKKGLKNMDNLSKKERNEIIDRTIKIIESM